MRIVMSSSDFFPNVGGVAGVVANLSRVLAKHGHAVTILHWAVRQESKTSTPGANLGGAVVREVRLSPAGRIRRRFLWMGEISETVPHLEAVQEADIIHCHTAHPDGFAIRYFPNTAVKVFTNHTSGFIAATRHSWRRLEWRYLLGGFDLILAPSRELVRLSAQCTRTPVVYIPNGVDPSEFNSDTVSREEARRRLRIPEDALVVLAVRRFEPKNGLRYLAEACPQVSRAFPRSLFVFCGPPSVTTEYIAIRSIIDRHGLGNTVRFEGSVPNNQMLTYYLAADVAVIPSLMEATSLSGLEAMACGVPQVATKVGGLAEILEDNDTGILVEPADPKALADAICRLLNSRKLRIEMGERARKAAIGRFSWEAVGETTENEYLSACARRRDAAK